MTIRSRWLGSLTVLILLVAVQGRAHGDAMFQVTSLGSGYSLNTDGDGRATTVTSGDGTRSYSFDKSPTVVINQQSTNDDYENQRFYLQNGSMQAGDLEGVVRGAPFDIRVPTIMNSPSGSVGIPFIGDWATLNGPPVSDLNARGEFVGTGLLFDPNQAGPNYPSFAAFSTPTGGTHQQTDSMTGQILNTLDDNLNHAIASDLGINLTSAVKVDDLGRIIAEGTQNGVKQDFLLTPDGVPGDPLPTPEPATWAVLALGAVAYVVRRRRAVA